MNAAQEFTAADLECVNGIRIMAAEMVQKANSGHPGAPMGLAPLAHVLWSRHLSCYGQDPEWLGRDRFVLSNGHACALQYVMLHLLGYEDAALADLKMFRQLDSRTPGHPESHVTRGVEVTTGPLGQGLANAVGLAMAQAHLSAESAGLFADTFTYCVVGDGCLMEGISHEACSLAGHLKLGRLIVIWDDNSISIDGATALAVSEDTEMRFRAYGFHTQHVCNGDSDLDAISAAISAARAVLDRPSFIRLTTTIGFGAELQGTAKVHGAPLGDAGLQDAYSRLQCTAMLDRGSDSHALFRVYREVRAAKEAQWTQWQSEVWKPFVSAHPHIASDYQRRLAGNLPAAIASLVPKYTPEMPALATRKCSETVLNAIAAGLPELVGGSADITSSNLTLWRGAVDFAADSPAGRYVRFGVREHAMFAICNGVSAFACSRATGGTLLLPFASTFLNFITYGWGAVRLSALAGHRVLYIMTHDSIGLGEDGPTHQPIETLSLLRATPGLLVLRPADGNEVSGAYLAALSTNGPSVICLSRQEVPQLPGSSGDSVQLGAYAVGAAVSQPQLVMVATGTEVSLCVQAAALLRQEDIHVRVVSMPCWQLFEKQPPQYRYALFPKDVPVISVEAASTLGWDRYAHVQLGIPSFGRSGPYKQVYSSFALDCPNLVRRARAVYKHYLARSVPDLVELALFSKSIASL